jgi:hypothetical protein
MLQLLFMFIFMHSSYAQIHAQTQCGGQAFDCVEYSCQKLGRLACDDLEELKQVHELCRDQAQSPCLSDFCQRLGTFACDSLSELQDTAQLCRFKPSLKCVEDSCRRLGNFACSKIENLQSISELCRLQN